MLHVAIGNALGALACGGLLVCCQVVRWQCESPQLLFVIVVGRL